MSVFRRSWSRAWLASGLLLEVATCSSCGRPVKLKGFGGVAGVVPFLRSTLPGGSRTLVSSNLLVCSLTRLWIFLLYCLQHKTSDVLAYHKAMEDPAVTHSVFILTD